MVFVIIIIAFILMFVTRAHAHEPPDPTLCEQIAVCEAEWVGGWDGHKLTWEARQPQPRRSDGVFRGMGVGVEQWRPLVLAYFGSDRVERALCLIAHESGGNPDAKNPDSTAAGLFQFLKSTWDTMVPRSVTGGSYDSGQVYLPEPNIKAAAWLQEEEGWTQWSPYNRGLCR